jgi:hypothetical protein
MADGGNYRRKCGAFRERSEASTRKTMYRQGLSVRRGRGRDIAALTHRRGRCSELFRRGVSDLGCGRGHDRRRGQISWSLTPRSPRCRGETVAKSSGRQHTPPAFSGREAAIAHLLAGPTEMHQGHLARIKSVWLVPREGEHPARSPVPLSVPPRWRYIERATLSGPFPGTSEPEPRAVGLRFRIQRDKAAQPNRQGPRPPPSWRRPVSRECLSFEGMREVLMLES